MAFSFLLVITIALRSGSQLHYGDEAAYKQLAANLIRYHHFTQDGLHSTAYRPPGYAWFLAIAELVHASNVQLRIFNASTLIFAQLFLFVLVRSIASDETALLALLLTLAYPVLFYTSILLFPQTLGAALLLCGMWLLLRPIRLTLSRAVLSGIVWALLILTIPTFLTTAALTLVILGWRRARLRAALFAVALTIAVLVGAWSYRNYTVFHSVVLVSTNGGVNLLLGNSDTAAADSSSDDLPLRYVEQGHSQPTEAASDKYYSGQARQWIVHHKARAGRLYLAKLIHYFAFNDHLVSAPGSMKLVSPGARTAIMVLTWGPLLLLFCIRLALIRRIPPAFPEILFIGLYLFNAAFISIFFTRIRFRLPMDWLLIAVDAGLLHAVLRPLLTGKKSRHPDPAHDCV